MPDTNNDDELGLDQAYALETPEDNRRLYANWADTYESGFMAEKGYVYHEAVADVFLREWGGVGTILDVGCGTGAVGVALASRGAKAIDGIDISAEMLAQARTKGVYGELVEADLTQTVDLGDDSYHGIVSAGTFTHGHLKPDALAELIRVAAPGARFAVGVNAAHFAEFGFDAWFDAAVADGRIGPYECVQVEVYEGSDPANLDDMSNIVVFEAR